MNPADLFSRDDNPVRLAPGELLFKAGDPADSMYVVLEGSLAIKVADRVVEHARRGAIVGEMALIDQAPRSATVSANEHATLARLDQRRFQFIVQQNPYFATHVMKVLVERLRQMNQLLECDTDPLPAAVASERRIHLTA